MNIAKAEPHSKRTRRRHAVELTIKSAIVEYARSAGETPSIAAHGLIHLWKELQRQISRAGYNVDDEWTLYCTKLIDHLHSVDPDGERFRYPTSRTGAPFALTHVELRELAVAHWRIAMNCDGSISMLHDLGRQSPRVPDSS